MIPGASEGSELNIVCRKLKVLITSPYKRYNGQIKRVRIGLTWFTTKRIRNVHRILAKKCLAKWPVGRAKKKLQDDTKMYLKEMGT
jgi:hypothetical protein